MFILHSSALVPVSALYSYRSLFTGKVLSLQMLGLVGCTPGFTFICQLRAHYASCARTTPTHSQNFKTKRNRRLSVNQSQVDIVRCTSRGQTTLFTVLCANILRTRPLTYSDTIDPRSRCRSHRLSATTAALSHPTSCGPANTQPVRSISAKVRARMLVAVSVKQ